MRAPIIPYQINYVKRVIGLPGETVEFRDNQVYINGNLLPEHRVIGDPPTPGDNQSALIPEEFEERRPEEKYNVFYSADTMDMVREGQHLTRRGYEFGGAGKTMKARTRNFCKGDSRDNSEDSVIGGFVPRGLIIGRAMLVVWCGDAEHRTEISLDASPTPG